MIAKLAACQVALEHGVTDIAIVSGRGVRDLGDARGTRIQMPAAASGKA
jgi:acetylglutamate kinase